jgi:hypothetical protein
MRSARLALLASASLLVSDLVSAQLIEVPGDHSDLQDAIDAASAGATILVHGGTFRSITVDKPLTIVGWPEPLILGDDSQPAFQPPITLAGPGSGEVILARIRVEGTIDGRFFGSSTPAITGGGFAELHVYDSFVHAPEWVLLTGLGVGEPGIETSVPFVLVERSDVKGSATSIDGTVGTSAWDGPAAISAPGATVAVFDSVVTGGDSALFTYPSFQCDFVCPDGAGGAGVAATGVFHSDSAIAGGFGAAWLTQGGLICCGGPNGQPIVATTVVSLPDYLDSDGPMRLGEDHVLHLSAPGPLATLRIAGGIDPPVQFPQGYRFLDPTSTASLGNVATPGDHVLAIPLDLSLLGRVTALQLVDPTSGFSRPVSSVLLPPRHDAHDPAGAPTSTVTRQL